jgi:hypothetical protein
VFGLEPRVPAAGNGEVVADGGRLGAHEGSDAGPAQSEPVHQHPFRARSAPQPPVHNGHHPATAAGQKPALLELIASVLKLADGDEVIWATDLNHGGPALLIALLVAHGQNILYIPGRIVHHASKLYRGDGKTDAKDAAVIADQARMRRDLQPLRAGDETSTGLRILTARRADKSADRVRAINRLQAQLLEYFPALGDAPRRHHLHSGPGSDSPDGCLNRGAHYAGGGMNGPWRGHPNRAWTVPVAGRG